MDDLRSEIRAAFEKEQSAHPPVAGLRRNTVDAVTAQDPRETNLQWLAVAAAVILGILVVAGLMSTRFAPRASVPANPIGPLKDYGPPPAGVSLLYVVDPRNTSWLQAYDWQGRPRGTVKRSQPIENNYVPGIDMAPDGSGFVDDQFGRSLRIQAGVGSDMWADDNRHRCFVRFLDRDWTLSTYLPGQAAQLVGVVAHDPDNMDKSVRLAACSFRNDLAILLRYTDVPLPGGQTGGTNSDLWVVRLSDGGIIGHHAYAYNALHRIVATSDAAYVAEILNPSPGPGPEMTQVRLVSDWTVISTLPPNAWVWQFSGDDSLILGELALGGDHVVTAIFDWRSEQVVWAYDGYGVHQNLRSSIAEPGGRDFALAWETQPMDPLMDVVIVHGDGTTTAIPGRVVPLW